MALRKLGWKNRLKKGLRVEGLDDGVVVVAGFVFVFLVLPGEVVVVALDADAEGEEGLFVMS
jgi:hypothetical protein